MDSINELLADEELELIVVNTPNYTHFDYTIKALKAGKHVLLEKPAAGTSNEVKIIYDLSKKVNKQVMVYQNRRWDSRFVQVKQIIESGRLGEIAEVHFRIDRFKRSIGNKSFKETPLIPGSGLQYDLGSHLLDNAICLFGKRSGFIKTLGTYRHGSAVADYFHYHLSYPDQLHVFLTSGLLIAEVLLGFTVHGSEGVL